MADERRLIVWISYTVGVLAHPWLMGAEQVLYVGTGYLLLLPLLGEEPIRPDPGYLLRLVLLLG